MRTWSLIAPLVLLTVALAGCTEGAFAPQEDPDAAADGMEASLDVRATEFSFEPSSLTVPAGVPIMVTLHNDGSQPHTWGGEFGGAGTVRTETVAPGEYGSVNFTVEEPGEYMFWCDVPGHRTGGMEGTLIVE